MTTKTKILLAEDDKFISKAYHDGLMRAGFEVAVVADGEQVLPKIKEFLPDIILLDLIMPVKNGFEVLTDISKEPKYAKIPVIVVSNLGQNSDVEKAKTLGAVDYLVKSNYSLKEIIEKIKSHL
ncbi:MAG: response regulator [Candidatus Falkowbacteria bacterium]